MTSVPRPAKVAPTALSALAGRAQARLAGADAAVTGVAMASDRVRPGDLFAAAPGARVHGIAFAGVAVASGAVAILTDAAGADALDGDDVPDGVPVLVVDDVRERVGPVAAAVYGDPSGSLALLGVTGTSGKTTTTYFVHAGLRAAGRNAGLIGTVGTVIGDGQVSTGFTTPEAPELQALLAVLRERGADSVAMEVSSHALALGRVNGCSFAVGAFTNLSEEHLDFHADMEEYFAAKARLFDGRSRVEIVNVDDPYGVTLAGPDTITVSTAGPMGAVRGGARPATWWARDIRTDSDGRLGFEVLAPHGVFRAGCAVPGRFNVTNALLALAILHEAGIADEVAVPAVAAATVPGRMERIEAGQGFLAVVDYCHKPAAVQAAVDALRPLTKGRLVVVLGCGGDRDRAKRPVMGAIAARGSDLLIVTDDNPRSEDPATIRAAMLDGAASVPEVERAEVREVGDRAEAIAAAVRAARPGDTVLVAGKGHEPGQEIDGVVHPFDDRDALREALGHA